VIVADDLTGACDSGVAVPQRTRGASGAWMRCALISQACRSGSSGRARRPGIHHGDAGFAGRPGWGSRRNLCRCAAGRVATRVCVQEDRLRGAWHFGLEISAALRASGANLALVAPAFPDAGRTVEAGALCVRDWSGRIG